MGEEVHGETERGECGTPLRSPEHELHRHPEPYGDGLITASGWFKAPLLDGIRCSPVEIWMPSGALNLDVPDPTVLQYLKE